MKRFFKITLCFLICVMAFGLVACGKNTEDEIDTSIASRGNGGMVVTAGDYIYFVNGYNSYEVFGTNNLSQKFEVGGLYRVKLDNGFITYDDNGVPTGVEQISDNLVGFESTSIYVFGNYVYYSTPTTDVTRQGELQTSKLDFCRVKTTGGKPQTIYQTENDATNVDFEFYYADGRVYLMVNENGTLKRVSVSGKKADTCEVDSEIASLVLHRDENDVYSSASYSNIFYTKNEDGVIKIYNYNVANNKIEYKASTDYAECELLDVKFGHLYYKAKKSTDLFTLIYRIDATKNAITNKKVEPVTKTEYDNFYFLENETNGYIAQTSDTTWLLTYDGTARVIDKSKLDIIAINAGYIYFKSDTTIKRINYNNLPNDTTQETVLSLENLKTYSYDIDSSNLYVYASSGSNVYVYSINVGNKIDGEEFEAKLLGNYKSGDAPTKEE